jgi:hypothetical protein
LARVQVPIPLRLLNRVAAFAAIALLILAGGCGVDGGAEGETCAARSDCRDGLACIESRCTPSGQAPGSVGAAGESCRAREDCADGLACVANVCIPGGSERTPTRKSCVMVECSTKDDCCTEFVSAPGCDQYQQDCAADPAYCLTYRLLCECNRGCEDQLCVDTPPGCAADAECASFTAPYCVDGACRECAEHGDCLAEGDRCIEGVCQAPCTVDEQCPLFSACSAGECVEVGCTSDLECVFFLGDTRATCGDAECRVPCASSLECAAVEVCFEGACIFVGCETDSECRAFFGLENEPSDVEAVCQ